ncbi:hypothetical protein EVAR_16742_1 [Eumeta japonica]|uniref:Uncharacterized protein n=1 Tax=Eumeta variegata TaxID=151549 RepID=A0A4C1UKX5_EUMVA|nr:hypothetical protein EVAR_16742_1 [Eumeta japonica]
MGGGDQLLSGGCLVLDSTAHFGSIPALHSGHSPTLDFYPGPVFNFNLGLALDSDPSPIFDCAPRDAFNSHSAICPGKRARGPSDIRSLPLPCKLANSVTGSLPAFKAEIGYLVEGGVGHMDF